MARTGRPIGRPAYPLVDRTCEWCKSPFKAKRCEVNRGSARFCSISCATSRKNVIRAGEFLDRFWKKVDRSNPEGCWIWMGSKNTDGYGNFWDKNQKRCLKAHRFSYSLAHDDLTPDIQVLHHCDTPDCVNPEHLYLGDQKKNMVDAASRGRMNPGEKRSNAILTEDSVRKLRADREAGMAYGALAAKYGVSSPSARAVCLRLKWSHVE